MKTKSLVHHVCLTACLGSSLLFGEPIKAAETNAPANDEQSIRNAVAAFDKAMNNKDARAFSMVFHEDADFTNVRGMSARGRKAIEDFHRPLFEGDGSQGVPSFKNAVFKVLDTHIRFLRPDVATVDVTWTQTGSVLNGQDRGLRKGLMTWVVTKERETWGVAVMRNMDLPLEPPPKAP